MPFHTPSTRNGTKPPSTHHLPRATCRSRLDGRQHGVVGAPPPLDPSSAATVTVEARALKSDEKAFSVLAEEAET